MSRDTTISNSKSSPGGFLIVAALFILTEALVYSHRPDLVDDFWNKFIINEHRLVELKTDYDYLIMGNSIQKTGIDPTQVSDKILNLGLPGSKPQGLYLLLKRYLSGHKPPKTIFLYVDPEDPRDSMFVVLRYFVNIPEFISIWKDLSWGERRCFIFRYWASLDLRRVGFVIRDKYPGGNADFVAAMKKNKGYMPSPRSETSISDDHFAKTNDRYAGTVSLTKKDAAYLDRFVKLAASNNIKIVLLGIVMPKELYDMLDKSGFNRDWFLFFEVMKRRAYPNVHFVDDPILFMENRYFGDMSHMNREGSKLYTEYFKNRVFRDGSSLPNSLKINEL